MLAILSFVILLYVGLCAVYLWTIALASIKPLPESENSEKKHRFAITIPAHDEVDVIGETVKILKSQDYPQDLFDVFVVADFCSDGTAQAARDQGAICYERSQGERTGKSAALRYLFESIFASKINYEAVVVFDADTRVDSHFLRVINSHLNQGAQVIQGRHVISNPHEGWFPAISWAMMTIDNRFSNQGRTNLKWSAKHMGDSICFRSDLLRKVGWGSGLTEDFDLRLRLLLEGIAIRYEPHAIGYGQAPQTWGVALVRGIRWAKGMADARKAHRSQLLREGLRELDWMKLDGAFNNYSPSFSTLTLISVLMLGLNLLLKDYTNQTLIYAWLGMVVLWFVYPLLGLALEKAPLWAYLVILTGPVFIFWRTALNIRARLAPKTITWVRTPHHQAPIKGK